MTTELEAINTMLSCIGQSPLNSLTGTKSYFTIAAQKILKDETRNMQMQGWDFNSEDFYQLTPDTENTITVPDDVLMIKFPTLYKNRYVVREGKLYDKFKHTFTIEKPLKVSVIFCYNFEDLPEVAQYYVTMLASYKFVKRELGAEKAAQFCQEDLSQALVAMEQYELETGEYTMIPAMYDGRIKGWL